MPQRKLAVDQRQPRRYCELQYRPCEHQGSRPSTPEGHGRTLAAQASTSNDIAPTKGLSCAMNGRRQSTDGPDSCWLPYAQATAPDGDGCLGLEVEQ